MFASYSGGRLPNAGMSSRDVVFCRPSRPRRALLALLRRPVGSVGAVSTVCSEPSADTSSVKAGRREVVIDSGALAVAMAGLACWPSDRRSRVSDMRRMPMLGWRVPIAGLRACGGALPGRRTAVGRVSRVGSCPELCARLAHLSLKRCATYRDVRTQRWYPSPSPEFVSCSKWQACLATAFRHPPRTEATSEAPELILRAERSRARQCLAEGPGSHCSLHWCWSRRRRGDLHEGPRASRWPASGPGEPAGFWRASTGRRS